MDAFKKDGVVSDIIDQVPAAALKVTYEGIDMTPGMVLTPTQVKSKPTVELAVDANAYHTLLMVDPDAPSRAEPTYGQINHWLIVNIPGNKITEGQVLAEYAGSGPPKGSGLHRYIFLLFKQQSGKQDFSGLGDLRRMETRMGWKVREFASKYQLGNPIAGNFYQAEWDEYCIILHEKFKAEAERLKIELPQN